MRDIRAINGPPCNIGLDKSLLSKANEKSTENTTVRTSYSGGPTVFEVVQGKWGPEMRIISIGLPRDMDVDKFISVVRTI